MKKNSNFSIIHKYHVEISNSMNFYDIQPFIVAYNNASEILNNCLIECNYSYDYGFCYEN